MSMVLEFFYKLDEHATVVKIGIGFFSLKQRNLPKVVKLNGIFAMQFIISAANILLSCSCVDENCNINIDAGRHRL